MSLDLTCPHCGNPSPSDLNFCFNCEEQVKCLHVDCGAILFPGKSKCLKCGRALERSSTIAGEIAPLNKYVHEVKKSTKTTTYEERQEFQGSNIAVQHLANTLTSTASNQHTPVPL